MLDQSVLRARRVRVEDSAEALARLCAERGWGDGLPIVAATPERVATMLAALPDDDPARVVARLPPYWGEATLEKVAVNAVMAGCAPEYFPVVVAAVEALGEPSFNLFGLQATTGPMTPLLIVHGPVAARLGIQSGTNALGPAAGARANATIGRAVRLALLHLGGGRPGELDKATLGQPAKFTYCLAENLAASPWPSLAVERGVPAEASAVTVVGAHAPVNVNDHESTTADGLLHMLAESIAYPANSNAIHAGETIVLLGPEHAALLARDGLSRRQMQEALLARARVRFDRFSPENLAAIRKERPHVFADPTATAVPVADRAEDFLVLVAGGAGKHSVFVSTASFSRAVTRPLAAQST